MSDLPRPSGKPTPPAAPAAPAVSVPQPPPTKVSGSNGPARGRYIVNGKLVDCDGAELPE